jgi:hypothetical protein
MNRRVVVAAAVVLLAAVALVAVARWERSRHADQENAGIQRVRSEIGELDGPTLAGFRVLQDFQCLIYRRNGRPFGLELCVDWDGRVVEAMDRRDGDAEIWSLREDPGRARVRVERRAFERVISTMCEECEAIFERARSPLGQARR